MEVETIIKKYMGEILATIPQSEEISMIYKT
jgi:hypothetical protein